MTAMDTAPPAVSVVIPTHNGRERVPDVLRALVAEAGTVPFEVIVIDNGNLVGAGTHESLLADCTTYAEFADSHKELMEIQALGHRPRLKYFKDPLLRTFVILKRRPGPFPPRQNIFHLGLQG